MNKPLSGIKVVEFSGIGPAPFCAMMLADMGADVVRIARPGQALEPKDVLARGRRVVELDLRSAQGRCTALKLAAHADIAIEGFRPGVLEHLGLGPQECLAENPRLVYGRMTGWGQHGPLSTAAGHDINYIALSGALHAMGRPHEPPAPPLNLVGDFGGGGMLLVVGVLVALRHVEATGQGQVVDAAMTDGAALLSSFVFGMMANERWSNHRGSNLLDGAAPFYDTYLCADGRYVALGPIEPQFYAELRERCGIEDPLFDRQNDRDAWPLQKLRLADIFRSRTRDEWSALLEGTDACFAPVLDWEEAPRHPHNVARGTFVEANGVTQPAPAPRFSLSALAVPPAPLEASVDEILQGWSAGLAMAGTP